MPPFALYLLPWLTLLACVLASLLLPPPLTATLSLWAFLGSSLLFGLPHGSADWQILRLLPRRPLRLSLRLYRQPASPPLPHPASRIPHPASSPSAFIPHPSSLILSLYVLASLVTLLAWYALPAASLTFFLFLTVWHFGTADASLLLPERRPLRDPGWLGFALGRGLLVIFLPFAFRPAETAAILRPFASLGQGTNAMIQLLAHAAPALVWVGAALQLVALRLPTNRRTLPWNLLETALLIAGFRLAPPLVAFTGYFVGFHAWRHLLRLEPLFQPAARRWPLGRAVLDFHVRTFPVSLLSLLGLVGIFALWPGLPRNPGHAVVIYLVLLSILTVPHATLISFLDWQKSRGTLPAPLAAPPISPAA